MDSTIYSYFGPFEDIPICGSTVWTIDNFEESIPDLLSMCDWTQNNDILSLTDIQMNQTLASGDCLSIQPKVESTQLLPQYSTQVLTQHSRQSSNNLNKNRKQNQIRFPSKLWQIVNECQTNAIKWSTNGESIVINYDLFQMQYLNTSQYFKTTNMCSFVRQLNLYGFYKINHKLKANSKRLLDNNFGINESFVEPFHEFKNKYFQRDCEELLPLICRRYSMTRSEKSNEFEFNDNNSRKRLNSKKSDQKEIKIKRRKKIKTENEIDLEDNKENIEPQMEIDSEWFESQSQELSNCCKALNDLLAQTLANSLSNGSTDTID